MSTHAKPMIDATERLRQHVECSLKRDEAARRAIKLFESGQADAGNAVAEEAELWALRALVLEPSNDSPIPQNC